MSHVWFRDTLSPKRFSIRGWPRPTYAYLKSLPVLFHGYVEDLRLELDGGAYRFRYWTSRLTLADRPQTDSGGYEGMYPRVQVEAEIGGSWVLIDGYQGHMV